jgi:hypothetical protein
MRRIIPIGFIGKDILAVEKDIKPVIEDRKAYPEQLPDGSRQADALPPIPEKTFPEAIER